MSLQEDAEKLRANREAMTRKAREDHDRFREAIESGESDGDVLKGDEPERPYKPIRKVREEPMP